MIKTRKVLKGTRMKKLNKSMSLLLCFALLFGGSTVFAEDNATTVPSPPGIAIPGLSYQTHVENIGWQGFVKENELSGTTGQSLRLEAIELKFGTDKDVRLQYETHIQNIGWQGLVDEGQISGTTGQCLRLEAIRIKLVGADAGLYNVYYKVHAQNFGWLGWAKNGESSGTAGFSDRLEGINVIIFSKYDDPFEGKYEPDMAFVEYTKSDSGTNIGGTWDGNFDHSFNTVPYDSSGSHGGVIFSGN